MLILLLMLALIMKRRVAIDSDVGVDNDIVVCVERVMIGAPCKYCRKYWN